LGITKVEGRNLEFVTIHGICVLKIIKVAAVLYMVFSCSVQIHYACFEVFVDSDKEIVPAALMQGQKHVDVFIV
jgi:hypothetical protein